MKIEFDFTHNVKHLETIRNEVGIVRDKLEEFLSEVEELRDTCNDAYESLDYAITRLSEQQ